MLIPKLIEAEILLFGFVGKRVSSTPLTSGPVDIAEPTTGQAEAFPVIVIPFGCFFAFLLGMIVRRIHAHWRDAGRWLIAPEPKNFTE